MVNYIIYFLGILFCSLGISVIIIYSNLLVFGFNIWDFFIAIIKTWEFYLLPVGIFIIIKDRF